jgi:cytochrome c5
MKFILCNLLLVFFFYSSGLPAMDNTATQNKQKTPVASPPPTGEAIFKANCGRCHMPPMTLSPRITGAVVMHMRTRARLSRMDERQLLRFLAP